MIVLARASAALVVALVVAPGASGHGGGIIKAALDGLRSGDPVYVDPNAIPTLETREATRLRERIAAAGGGIYVAVLPADAQHETADKVLEAVIAGIGADGAYAVVVGGQLRADSRGEEPVDTGALAREVAAENPEQGLGTTLTKLVDRLGEERRGTGGNRSTWAIVAALGGFGLLAVLATLVRARRRSSVG
jgi:hypothetical protein